MHFRARLALVVGALVLSVTLLAPLARAQSFDSLFQKATQLEQQGKKQEALAEYNNIATAQAANPEAAGEALARGIVLAETKFGVTGQEHRDAHDAAQEMWKKLLGSYPNSRGAITALDFYLDRAKEKGKEDGKREIDQLFRDVQGRSPELAAEALYQEGLFESTSWGKSDEDISNGNMLARQAWRRIYLDFPNTQAFKKLTEPQPGHTLGALGELEQRIDKHNASDYKYQILNSLVSLTGRNPSYSYAVALIVLACLVKLILLPLTRKQYAGMREMQRMQPLVKAIQDKGKKAGKTHTQISQETMELYKEHGVNPFAGCWPTLVQLPFLIFMFRAIQTYELAFANGHFLWIGSGFAKGSTLMLLGHKVFGRSLAEPDIVLLAIYVVTNYLTMRMTPASDPSQQQQQQTMALMTSVIFFYMFLQYSWSSAFVLYWLAQNVLSIWQQYEYIYKPNRVAQQSGGSPMPAAGMAGPSASSNGVGKPAGEASSITDPAAPQARVKPRKKKR